MGSASLHSLANVGNCNRVLGCAGIPSRSGNNLPREGPAIQAERPLFLDEATFADASGSDGLAPLSAIRGASVNRGGPTPEQPFGIIPNGASVAFTLIFLREASAPAFALAHREGWA